MIIWHTHASRHTHTHTHTQMQADTHTHTMYTYTGKHTTSALTVASSTSLCKCSTCWLVPFDWELGHVHMHTHTHTQTESSYNPHFLIPLYSIGWWVSVKSHQLCICPGHLNSHPCNPANTPSVWDIYGWNTETLFVIIPYRIYHNMTKIKSNMYITYSTFGAMYCPIVTYCRMNTVYTFT